MARAYNNVLAMLIATIGLAIPLTANMHTPKLIDMFLRDRINRVRPVVHGARRRERAVGRLHHRPRVRADLGDRGRRVLRARRLGDLDPVLLLRGAVRRSVAARSSGSARTRRTSSSASPIAGASRSTRSPSSRRASVRSARSSSSRSTATIATSPPRARGRSRCCSITTTSTSRGCRRSGSSSIARTSSGSPTRRSRC